MKERIVCVEWEDAGFNAGYYDVEKPSLFKPIKTKTAGFVVKSNRDVVVVSHDRFYDEKGKLDDQRHITVIPRGMIRHITDLCPKPTKAKTEQEK